MQNRCRGDLGESNAIDLSLRGFEKAEAIQESKADSRESSGDLCDSHTLNADDFNILVAKCGKTIGLKGEIRLIVYSDFDEIFTKGNVFLAKDSRESSANLGRESKKDSHESSTKSNGLFLTLQSFNSHKKSATFDEIQSIDEAKNLTSLLLYSSETLSQKYCILGENEHFWFEIIGMCVVENDEIVGVVRDIERIGSVDYLIVATNPAIFAKYPHIKAKRFYIPYILRYILRVEKCAPKSANPPQDSQDLCESKGNIFTQDSLGILENS